MIDVKQGGFLKQIGHSGGRGKLSGPTSVTVVGEFVYVSACKPDMKVFVSAVAV